MRKLFTKFISQMLVGLSLMISLTSANAQGMNALLDGMFYNMTPPSVIDNQFSGGLNLGSAYIRSPISSVQLFAVDPPRFSAGCGGIDVYLGAFTHVSSEKLIQFLRNIAQNAVTIAFQLALESVNPQLSGMLKAFNDLATKVNMANKNSCEIARGLMIKGPGDKEIGSRFMENVLGGVSSAGAAVGDFAKAMSEIKLFPGTKTDEAKAQVGPDNKPVVPETQNITWNALRNRKIDGTIFTSIADTDTLSREILMSIIGTSVTEAKTPTATPSPKPFLPTVRIKNLIAPDQFSNGATGVRLLQCVAPNLDLCLNVTQDGFWATNGIRGYVNSKMYGNSSGDVATLSNTSIIGRMSSCAGPSCVLSDPQKRFLNSLGNVPAITLLTRAQRNKQTMQGTVGKELVDMMVTQIALQYAAGISDLIAGSFSGTDTPKPDGLEGVLKEIKEDIKSLEEANESYTARILQISAMLDVQARSNFKNLRK